LIESNVNEKNKILLNALKLEDDEKIEVEMRIK